MCPRNQGKTRNGLDNARLATLTSVGGGTDFEPPAQVSGSGNGVGASPSLVWDTSDGPHNGRLYLVYGDTVNPGDDYDIFVRFADPDDGWATWSDRTQVNDNTNDTDQFLPNISLDQTTGHVAVSWHDARNDQPQGIKTQFFGAVSLGQVSQQDGKLIFGANFQISTGTSDGRDTNSFTGYGDYTGSAFHAGVLYPVWADNSISTDFDMYTAAIEFDTDQDGDFDSVDNCIYTNNADQTDFDDDFMGDACDNCIDVPNSPHVECAVVSGLSIPCNCDADDDGYGNMCDADMNNDFIVGGPDFATFTATFDLPPGPSGLSCAGMVGSCPPPPPSVPSP